MKQVSIAENNSPSIQTWREDQSTLLQFSLDDWRTFLGLLGLFPNDPLDHLWSAMAISSDFNSLINIKKDLYEFVPSGKHRIIQNIWETVQVIRQSPLMQESPFANASVMPSELLKLPESFVLPPSLKSSEEVYQWLYTEYCNLGKINQKVQLANTYLNHLDRQQINSLALCTHMQSYVGYIFNILLTCHRPSYETINNIDKPFPLTPNELYEFFNSIDLFAYTLINKADLNFSNMGFTYDEDGKQFYLPSDYHQLTRHLMNALSGSQHQPYSLNLNGVFNIPMPDNTTHGLEALNQFQALTHLNLSNNQLGLLPFSLFIKIFNSTPPSVRTLILNNNNLINGELINDNNDDDDDTDKNDRHYRLLTMLSTLDKFPHLIHLSLIDNHINSKYLLTRHLIQVIKRIPKNISVLKIYDQGMPLTERLPEKVYSLFHPNIQSLTVVAPLRTTEYRSTFLAKMGATLRQLRYLYLQEGPNYIFRDTPHVINFLNELKSFPALQIVHVLGSHFSSTLSPVFLERSLHQHYIEQDHRERIIPLYIHSDLFENLYCTIINCKIFLLPISIVEQGNEPPSALTRVLSDRHPLFDLHVIKLIFDYLFISKNNRYDIRLKSITDQDQEKTILATLSNFISPKKNSPILIKHQYNKSFSLYGVTDNKKWEITPLNAAPFLSLKFPIESNITHVLKACWLESNMYREIESKKAHNPLLCKTPNLFAPAKKSKKQQAEIQIFKKQKKQPNAFFQPTAAAPDIAPAPPLPSFPFSIEQSIQQNVMQRNKKSIREILYWARNNKS